MDRRTFITTSTAAAVGLGANSLLTGRAQGKEKEPRPISTEGFWPNKARLVISLSMQFEQALSPKRERAVHFHLSIRNTLIYLHKNGTTMVSRKAFRVCSICGTALELK